MISAKAALQPENEAPRRSGKTTRGTTNLINNSEATNTTTALRLQRLRLLGVIGQRADMLAGLVWEAAHG